MKIKGKLGMEYLALFNDVNLMLLKFDDAECGKLVKMAINYELNGVKPNLEECPRELAMFYQFIEMSIDAAVAKRSKKAETNRENGLHGGRPPKAKSDDVTADQNASQSETPELPANPTGFSRFKLACTDGTYILTNDEIERLKDCYKEIDVEEQMARFAWHLDQNPGKRDTIQRTRTVFLTNWMNKAKPIANPETNSTNTPTVYADESSFYGGDAE